MAFSEHSARGRHGRHGSPDYSSKNAPHNMKTYDFRTPKKFTKEHLRTLNTVADNFTRDLVANLSGMLRIICEATGSSIEEVRYGEYIETLPSKTFVGYVTFNSEENDGRETTALFHVPSTIGYFLIDVLLGGSGQAVEINRSHTDIECAIIENLVAKFCGMLEVAWKNIGEVKLTLEESETNPKMIQIMSPNDSVIVMSVEVKLGHISDKMSICIPSLFLDEILAHIDTKNKVKIVQRVDVERDKMRKQLIYDALSDTELELKAVLCYFELGMSDLLSLQVDDVIPLDVKITDDIKILVDEVPWFNAKLGQSNIKKAVKLCSIAEQPEPQTVN